MTEKTEDLMIQTTPTRATLTMRDIVILDAQIGAEEVQAATKLLNLPETEEGEWGTLDVRLVTDTDDGSSELVMGDFDEEKGTFLTLHFDPPPEYARCAFRLVLGQERLAGIWRQARQDILAYEQAAFSPGGRTLIGLVRAALQFASDEAEGGSPVQAFNEWLAATGRKGQVGIPMALPQAA